MIEPTSPPIPTTYKLMKYGALLDRA